MDCDKKLKKIMELAKKISKEKSLSKAIETYIDYVKFIIMAERCTIFLHNKEEETVRSLACHGSQDIVAPASKGIVGMTIISKQTQFSNDTYSDFRFNKDVDKKTGFLTKQILSVPILNQDEEVLGVIQALNSQNKEFTPDDIELLEFLASYSSLGIENLLLKDESLS